MLVHLEKGIVGVFILLAIVCGGAGLVSAFTENSFWGEVFDNHGSIMLLIEVDTGRIVNANQAASAFYGYSTEQLEMMNIGDLNVYSPEEIERERRAAAEQERNHFVFPHKLASGEIRTVEVFSYPTGEDKTVLFSIINDITARVQAQTALFEHAERLRRAETITQLGHWEFNLVDNRAVISDGARKVLGLSQDVLIITQMEDLILPEYRQQRDQAFDEMIQGISSYDIEFKAQRADDGSIIHVHSIGEYDPETHTVFGVLLDVTERIADLEALEASRRTSTYTLSLFIVAQLGVITLLIANIRRRKRVEEQLRRNLEQNTSLIRLYQHQAEAPKTLLENALHEAVKLTESQYGLLFIFDNNTEDFRLSCTIGENSYADTADFYKFCRDLCQKAAKTKTPVFLNRAKLSPSAGAPFHKTMAFPLKDNGAAVCVVIIGEKSAKYGSQDELLLTLLFSNAWTIVERKQHEQAYIAERDRLRTTLLSVGDGVITTDRLGKVEMMNQVAEKLTGWSNEQAKGRAIEEVFTVIHSDTRKQHIDLVKQVVGTKEITELGSDVILIARDGTERHISDSAAPILQKESGEVQGVVIVFRDITEERAQQDAIEYLSYHDQLTGLYNRRYFEEQLVRLDDPANLPLSIIMADLNGLKLTNDAFGHQMGDELLQKAAAIISGCCRSEDVVARWGGDEFVILLPKTSAQGAEMVVKRIEQSLLNEKVGSVYLSLSLGWRTKYNEAQQIQGLFQQAETQMYRTKLLKGPSMRGETVQAIMSALFEKSRLEEEHSEQVSELSMLLGKALALNESEIEELGIIGLYHDIGKISINESVVNKPSALTEAERAEIRRHSEVGYRILSSVKDMADIAKYVLSHHERWDGGGYPKGISGKQIPIQSRIVSVADAYDAMVNDRPYRKALSHAEAVSELKRCAGSHFDPEVVAAFLQIVDSSDGIADLKKYYKI